MSLPHALLTALTEQPSSGSDLAARFDRSIGHFWHATHQQIYRELARLEEAGLIESLPEASTRGRKRAYRILAAGRRELTRWVDDCGEPTPLRDDMMVRLWAEASVGPTDLRAALLARRGRHEQQLAHYCRIEARDFVPPPTDRAGALRHVVLQTGIQYERFWLSMVAQALEALDRDPGEP